MIAADTVGWLNGQVIGKPDDEADARRIIRGAGGHGPRTLDRRVPVARPGDWQFAWQERSLVRMKPLTDAEIDAYLQTRKWEAARRLCDPGAGRPVPDGGEGR